jgi:predicted nucleotidyltransferase
MKASSRDDAQTGFVLCDQALVVLRDDARVSAVYLHGSQARGEARADSDVDLGLLPVAGITFTDYERALLASELGLLLHKTVDVGEVSSRNLVYAKEVVYKGVPVFVRDERYARLMEMTLLSMYASFNEDRKEVMDAWTA